MKYGFLGVGNMGEAIVRRLTSSGFVSGEEIIIYDISEKTASKTAAETGAKILENSLGLAEAETIFLCLKPQTLFKELQLLRDTAAERKPLLISVAAGVTIEKFETFFGEDIPIIRIMPNLSAKIGQSVTAVCANAAVKAKKTAYYDASMKLFENLGQVFEIEESFFDVFTAIASCSPAYLYAFIDVMATAAVKAGLARNTAVSIITGAFSGALINLMQGNETPREIIDKITSPGGVTIKGLCALAEHGFDNAVIKAVEASGGVTLK